MDLKTQLEAIATANGWTFVYGRRDFQNLFDASAFMADSIKGVGNDETVLFVDPIKLARTENGEDASGSLMILTRANHDHKYDDRYSESIEPLRASLKSMYNGFKCNWDVIRWEATEVINVLDLNADGYLLSYQLNGYE